MAWAFLPLVNYVSPASGSIQYIPLYMEKSDNAQLQYEDQVCSIPSNSSSVPMSQENLLMANVLFLKEEFVPNPLFLLNFKPSMRHEIAAFSQW